MPVRPNTPCRKFGCKSLISPPGYCLEHKHLSNAWSSTSIKSSTDRGYGWSWTKLRKKILERDQGLCKPCAHKGRVSIATEVDHIKPKHIGGDDSESNLQAICSECHKAKTKRDTRLHR